MKLMKSVFTRTVITALFGALAFAGVASAQHKNYSGKFTLPVAARWGNVVLPAGDYTFTLESGSSSSTENLTLISDARRSYVGRVMPIVTTENHQLHGNDCLVLGQNSETTVVQELRLASAGIDITYAPSTRRGKRQAEEAQMKLAQIEVTRATN
jgi:hypothetical protein